MHDGIPYGRNQGQRQGHSREVDRQSPTGLIFHYDYCYSAADDDMIIVVIMTLHLPSQ